MLSNPKRSGLSSKLMALAGVLYARWGSLAYGAMAALAVAGGVCALAARRLASRGV